METVSPVRNILVVMAILIMPIGMNAQVRITAPDPALPLLEGDDVRIEWQGNDGAAVALWYSLDNGTVWKLLAAGLSASSYDWTIPLGVSDLQFRVSTLPGAGPVPLMEILDPHSAEIRSIEMSRDGREILSAGRDGEVQVRRSVDGSLINSVTLPLPRSLNMARYLHGSNEVVITQDTDVALWQRNVDQVSMLGLQGHTDFIRALAVHPERRIVASAGNDGTVRVWDVDTRALLKTFDDDDPRIYTLAFSADGTRLAYGGTNGFVHVRAWETEAETAPPSVQHRSHGIIREQPDGSRDTSSRVIWGIEFAPDGSFLASGSVDRTARIWPSAPSATEAAQIFSNHTSTVWTVDVAPNSARVLSASLDRTIRQWDFESGAEIGLPLDHGGQVLAVVYSPTGDTIVSAGRDNDIRLWTSGINLSAADTASYAVSKAVELYIPDITAFVNERLRVPVMIRNRAALDLQSDIAISAVIESPAVLLGVFPETDLVIERVNGRTESIRLALTLRPDSDILGFFTARALLGVPTTQPIRFDSVDWKGANFAERSDDGSITIISDCGLGERQVALGADGAGFISLSPNPAAERMRIHYVLPADGPARMDILTLRGDVHSNVFNGHALHGSYELYHPVNSLPAGEYFLRLDIGVKVYTRKFVVLK